MRLLPALLLLSFLAAPLSGAAVDPGARPLLEPDGARSVTAGTLGTQWGRIVFGTTDPGSNSLVPRGIPDEPTWFIFDPTGQNEVDAGGVDPTACSSGTGGLGEDDCKTDVIALAADATGLRVAAVGLFGGGMVITFNPFDGSPATQEVEDVLEVGQFDMDSAGSRVAVTYRVGVAWYAMHYSWSGSTVTPWDDPAPLAEQPTDLDMAPDGSTFAVAAGEHYYRFDASGEEPSLHDAQFIGTGRSVAVSADSQHTGVMGTSSGRLTFHRDGTEDDDQLLNFKRASSAITEVAIARDGKTVAWGNAAGSFGVGTYTAGTNIFQVLHEAPVGAEPTRIVFDAAGGHVAVLAGGDLHLFAVHEDTVRLLWSDEDPGPLVERASLSISDDGQAILVPRTDGIRVYDAVHDLNVTGDNPTLVPGREGQLILRFRNDGNRLAATSLQATAPEGWTVTPDEESVVVEPDETVQVAVHVTPAPSAEPGPATLEFVTKDRAGADVKHRVSVDLQRVVDWAIGMREGAPQTLSVDAGEPATFHLFVENRGNTPRAPPLRLDVEEDGWDARFTSGDGTVQPGQRADLDVRVTAPAGALELDEATVTVQLDGFGEPVELRAVVGAVFGVELDAPGGVEVEDGGSRTFNVTVRNAGNTDDGVRLGFGDLPAGWEGRFSFGLTEISVKDLAPGEERTVPVTIQVAPGEELDVPFLVALRASSFGDPDNVTEEEILVKVVEAVEEEPKDNDSPGLPLLGLLVAVGVAVVLRRRR